MTACQESPAPVTTPFQPAFADVGVDSSLWTDLGNPIETPVLLTVGSNAAIVFYSRDPVNRGFRYAECAANCLFGPHWSVVALDTACAITVAGATLHAGGLHVLHNAWSCGPPASAELVYQQCSAACSNPQSWSRTTVDSIAAAPSFYFSYYQGVAFTSDSAGTRLAAGVLKLDTLSGNVRVEYRECLATCNQTASWSSARIDSGAYEYLENKVAATTTSDGAVHLLYVVNGLRYATCSANCGTPGSWTVALLDPAGTDPVLIASPDGRLHAAYRRGQTLRYETCASLCTNTSGWLAAVVDTPAVTLGGLALAITSQGVVHLTANQSYLRCDSACIDPSHWQRAPVPLGVFQALRVDPNGIARIAHVANALHYAEIQ